MLSDCGAGDGLLKLFQAAVDMELARRFVGKPYIWKVNDVVKEMPVQPFTSQDRKVGRSQFIGADHDGCIRLVYCLGVMEKQEKLEDQIVDCRSAKIQGRAHKELYYETTSKISMYVEFVLYQMLKSLCLVHSWSNEKITSILALEFSFHTTSKIIATGNTLQNPYPKRQ